MNAWRAATELLEPSGRKLALFEDGKTAIAAIDVYPNRIDLGFHPVSDLANDGYYDSVSDTGKLIANTLLLTASFSIPPTETLMAMVHLSVPM